ncbi:MAG: hypothetical protein D4R82_05920 [Dehalococcoidia bacterium]|nr:MAG: hypothetical protein D4R82_05920 [Dehalococcoidia bacterium]
MCFWQWFTLITGIIGVVAFLIAILSLFHIWGKPKIQVSWDCAHGYRLTCWIRNIPINSVLSHFNVVRTQIEIAPFISIVDKNGRTLHFLHYAPNISDDIRLVIAEVICPQNGTVYFKDVAGMSTAESLAVGSYKLILELWGDGRKLNRTEGQIQINPSKPFIEYNYH